MMMSDPTFEDSASLNRSALKCALILGIFMILSMGSNISIYGPSYYMFDAISLNLGILFIIVAVGGLLVRQDMDRKATSQYFYGLLLIGAGPAFLIYSYIAKTGYIEYLLGMDIGFVYFRTSNWWIFSLVGVIFIALGAFLLIRSWRYRRSVYALR